MKVSSIRYDIQWSGLLISIIYAIIIHFKYTIPSRRYLIDLIYPQYDRSISHPYKGDTISSFTVVAILYAYLLLHLIIFEILLSNDQTKKKDKCILFLNILFGSIENAVFTGATTQIIKYNVGFLRPDFLSVCYNGNQFTYDINDKNNINCTNKDKSLIESEFLSFPSGHASISFALGWYITLYYWWCLLFRAWDFRKSYSYHLFKKLFKNSTSHNQSLEDKNNKKYCFILFIFYFGYIPMAFATYVSISRITDWRHHPVDIVAGGLIGFFFAFCSFLHKIFSYQIKKNDKNKSDPGINENDISIIA